MRFCGRQIIAAAALAALLFAALPVPTAFAGSDLRSAGGGGDRSGVGTVAWSNPGNITISDSNYAKAAMAPLAITHYLVARNFGFSIPSSAPIVGVQATILRKASSTVSLQDNAVRLLKGGFVVGDNKAGGTKWANTFVSASYGGPSDLWGVVLSPADVNAGNFGVVLSVANTHASLSRSASVDLVQISVTYGVHTTTGVDCTGAAVYGAGTSCTVTVTRTVGLNTPDGSVAWTSDGSGTFSGGGVCMLSGSGASGTCSVTYTPSTVGDGSHLITAAYAGDENFAGSSGNQALTVNPRPITVTADARSKTYGDPDPALTYQLTSGSLVGGDNFSGGLTRQWGENVGTRVILRGTLTAGPNYDLTYVGANLTIIARPITVTADDKSKKQGEADPALTYQVTSGSLAFDDTLSGALTRDPGEAMGTYPIQQGTLAAGSNYNMTFVPGTLTITAPNLPPTDISLSPSSVRENRPAGTTVGTLTTTDPDTGDTFTYTFCGGTDDGSFALSGSLLKTAAKFDYETKSSYSVCVQTDDGHGGTFQKTLPVTVLNLPETFTSQPVYDGWVLEFSETSTTGGSMDSTATWFSLGDNALKKQFRSVLSFNTAGIPDNAVITKVSLQIRRLAAFGTNPFTTHQKLVIDVRTGAFSGFNSLQLTDFNAPGSLNSAGVVSSTPLAGGWFKGSLYNAGLAKINKTGLTQLRLRFQLDDDNDAVADFLKFYSGNAVTPADRPVLTIEYMVP